ncbi:Transcription factor GRAS [Macleaya cordata]|uniref:Transcription factor GRAS n=1 Tax=Macleaya cordata TaxID=56857 RepID=A0A200QRX0_MACCD|nr:Transcription factor GRAS [Macleaya cordata]
MKAELRSTTTPVPLPNPNLFDTPQSSLSGALIGCLGTLDGACIEKLLLHCASALENNDVTFAQQVMWVLNNVASSMGDPNQRLTSWFLRALISRASRVCANTAMNFHGTTSTTLQRSRTRQMSVTELAGYVDIIPWHRFGFCASNSSILKAIQGHHKVHILDFSITHCMQWPTLIDALSKRPEGPPLLRLTVPSCRPPVPPFLNVSIEEVGLRLANFAKSRDVPFEFKVINGSSSKSSHVSFNFELLLSQLNPSLLDLRDDEALVINCQNWLRYLPDALEGRTQDPSFRDGFLEIIRGLNPHIVVVVDEDSDLDIPSLKSRITACFNYLWIPFDALETFLPKDSCQRSEYEADIGHKIENMIGFEGLQRMERLESGPRLVQRMKNANFTSVPFCEETVREVKFLLDEHASGWGMKKEDEMLVLTWKGHSSVFATTWVPFGCEDYIKRVYVD